MSVDLGVLIIITMVALYHACSIVHANLHTPRKYADTCDNRVKARDD